MNIEKFYCRNANCAETTLYNGVKPRFCAFCGQSFAVFANTPVKPKAEPVNQEIIDNNPFFEPTPTIRPASYYRNRSKAKGPELEEDDLDNDTEDDDDGEQSEFGADSGESLQQLFGQGLAKRNKGVKFGDIISKETIANEQPKPEASKPKAKRGRPKKG